MVRGSDIRAYRRLLKLSQGAFAKRIGLSQPTLSLVENETYSVTPGHLESLAAVFNGSEPPVTWSAFVAEAERQRATQAAGACRVEDAAVLLPVYRLDTRLDLSRSMPREEVVGSILVETRARPALAFQTGEWTAHWLEHEVLAFVECEPAEISPPVLCVLYFDDDRGHGLSTVLGQITSVARRGKGFRFQPLIPTGKTVHIAADKLRSILKLHFRGHYTK